MGKTRSVLGETHGYLTVISERSEVGKKNGKRNYRYAVLVKCICGEQKMVTYQDIKHGIVTNCGCIKYKKIGVRNNLSRSKEYSAWAGMIKRCYNPTYKLFHRYGGRGITVFQDWIDSFQCFLDYIGNKPSKYHSLDRIDNNGNYEPGNVKWSTNAEQSSNRSTNRLFCLNGVKKTLKQWSEIYNIKYGTLHSRITKNDDIYIALTSPIDKKQQLNSLKKNKKYEKKTIPPNKQSRPRQRKASQSSYV